MTRLLVTEAPSVLQQMWVTEIQPPRTPWWWSHSLHTCNQSMKATIISIWGRKIIITLMMKLMMMERTSMCLMRKVLNLFKGLCYHQAKGPLLSTKKGKRGYMWTTVSHYKAMNRSTFNNKITTSWFRMLEIDLLLTIIRKMQATLDIRMQK